MRRYAIDIVILPPGPVASVAIAWNRRLAEVGDQSITLNHGDTLPHISMLMGCIRGDILPEAKSVLELIASHHAPLTLNVSGLRYTDSSHPVAALNIMLSRELAEFQRRLITGFQPIITQDVHEEDFTDPPVSASSLEWVNGFITEQCEGAFWPHITLGHGTLPENQPPLTFKATRIAICHLGNHCTCRDILAEATLKAERH